MYTILIKYVSKVKEVYWKSHVVTNEQGERVEFHTDSKDVLKEELTKLDEIYGHENLRAIIDIPYVVSMALPNEPTNIATPEEVTNLYNTAFTKVFGGV